MTKFNIDRDRLIAVVRYPQQGDPTAVSYAVAEAEAGHATQITVFDPFTWEVEESYRIPLSPGVIRAALDEGDIEPVDISSMDGVELYNGNEVEQADRSDYIPDHIAKDLDDIDAEFTTANQVKDSNDNSSENSG